MVAGPDVVRGERHGGRPPRPGSSCHDGYPAWGVMGPNSGDVTGITVTLTEKDATFDFTQTGAAGVSATMVAVFTKTG